MKKVKKEVRANPSKYAIKVGKSSSGGLGMFALEDIPKGKKILQYGGWKLTNAEAEKRGGKYLFEMIDGKNTLDGTPRWNLARYFNHSCKPNCEGVWYGNSLWICTKRAVKAGEELMYHYGKDYYVGLLGGAAGCLCLSCKTARGDIK